VVGRAINLCFLKTRIQYEGEDENLLKEDYTGPGPLLAWYVQDGLGSIRQLVSNSNKVFNSYAYTAWGVPSNWHEKVSNRYTFTSREYCPETSLYHYRLRQYDACLGLFTKRETPPGWFRYVYNRPTVLADPYGMQARPRGPVVIDVLTNLWLYDKAKGNETLGSEAMARDQRITPYVVIDSRDCQGQDEPIQKGRRTNAPNHWGPVDRGNVKVLESSISSLLEKETWVAWCTHSETGGARVSFSQPIQIGTDVVTAIDKNAPEQFGTVVAFLQVKMEVLELFACWAGKGGKQSLAQFICDTLVTNAGVRWAYVYASEEKVKCPAYTIYFCWKEGTKQEVKKQAYAEAVAVVNGGIFGQGKKPRAQSLEDFWQKRWKGLYNKYRNCLTDLYLDFYVKEWEPKCFSAP